jgi:hypothetical protein
VARISKIVTESHQTAKLRRRTLLLGWSAVTLGLLVIALFVTLCVVMYLRYERGLGG